MATRRGFTDHEHLDEVELIHMNGRVYDYNLGRFMSVDPFIQSPTNSQSLNPYSYIMNNPLSGTDPTGYFAGRESKTEEAIIEGTVETKQFATTGTWLKNKTQTTAKGTIRRADGSVQKFKITQNGSGNINASVGDNTTIGGQGEIANSDFSNSHGFGNPVRNDRSANSREFDRYINEFLEITDKPAFSADIEITKTSSIGGKSGMSLTEAVSVFDDKLTVSTSIDIKHLPVSFVLSKDESGEITSALQMSRGPIAVVADQNGKIAAQLNMPLGNKAGVTIKTAVNGASAAHNRDNVLKRLVQSVQGCVGGSSPCAL
tara:strand:- start:5958 stop:6908 length:951 start_codon:yes stop_codon:yes gene_type:complete